MTTSVAQQRNRPAQHGRGLAIMCAALVVCGSAATSQAAAQAAGPAPAAAEAATPALTRAQIDALLAKPDKVLILDVRRADEISTIGGFPAYLNIQVADLERYLAFIPRDRQIVTVSNHAARAGRAAALLDGHGFKVAGAAGAQDYAAQGGVLTGQKPVAAAANAAAAQ